MGNWCTCKLGELLEIKHGFAFKGEYFSDKGQLVLLTPGNFREDGGLKLKGEKEKFYIGPFPDEYLLKRGDMLVAMTDLIQNAPILGSPAIVPADGRFLHNQRLGKIVNLKTERVMGPFLFYLFNTEAVRGHIKGSATGSTVRHTSPSRIYDVPVALPPLSEQSRIAGILFAYDELIENSQQRIRVLETMARSLYREWFVNFRFPGREKVRRVSSALGEIPEGWEVKGVKDVANVTYGFAFKSDWFNTAGRGVPVIRIRNILDGSTDTYTDEPADVKYHIENGDIVIGMDGDFHMCIWSSGHALQNQRVAKFESVGDIGNYHLFLALELPIHTWNNSIVGTTVAHLGDSHIKTICIVWPPVNILEKTRAILEPLSEKIILLKRQIKNLRQTRDLLLPRLLSGQIPLGAD